ncbi:MAG: Asp23/Gls24 family envelope stress response protein [Clostridia bacterium]|nr:Asp23/Gls24 family envelope stress response protein [Clostridia bacterium]
MSLRTSNKYGKISISDEAVAMVCSYAASECYGVVELVSRRLTDNLSALLNKSTYGKGIKIATIDNKIFIEVFVILKLGVNVEAVKDSLANTVTYACETFTGMRVKRVNINVVGIRV